MYGKIYMRFDYKKNVEAIYLKENTRNEEPTFNIIGKTFIDFLANSDKIMKVIEEGISRYNKEKKLTEHTKLYTIERYKLKKINPFFKYFDFNEYLENYLKNLRDNNNIKIHNYLEILEDLEKDLKKFQSQEYYEELIYEEIMHTEEYNSKKINMFYDDIEQEDAKIDKLINKYAKTYKKRVSYNTLNKIHEKNKKYVMTQKKINAIEEEIFFQHEQEIKKRVNTTIQKNIIKTKKIIKDYKHLAKKYVKTNESELEKIYIELVEEIKFWINFSKYILTGFYNLSPEQYGYKFSNMQGLLNYVLNIPRTIVDQGILKIPSANLTLEINSDNEIIDLYKLMKEKKLSLLYSKDKDFYKMLNNYKVSLIQEYNIKNIQDFLSVSLMQVLQNKTKICMCKNCGKLFISTKKSNEKYCTYKYKGQRSCRDLSYAIYLQKNELSNILRKKYRTENARKNRNIHIPNIQIKFDNWYLKAKEQKKLCERNKISVEEFKDWFEKNRNWF